jgi:serine/threonine-protein kinase HipA
MRGDRWNVCRVEAATLALARACGLEVPQTALRNVGGRDVLLVRRFDRQEHPGGFLKHRMVSALTVLQDDDAATGRERWSYLLFADELRRWVADPAADARQLFTRVVFNACVSNLDDHPRNHALIAPAQSWRLSPAYDLNPSPVLARDRRDLALDLGVHGRWANRHNLLSRCDRFGLGAEEATQLIDRIKSTVAARWNELMEAAGVSAADRRTIAPAFDYPGFELAP